MEGDLPRRHEGATTAGEYDERHICIYQDLSLHQDRLACGAERESQSEPARAKVSQREPE